MAGARAAAGAVLQEPEREISVKWNGFGCNLVCAVEQLGGGGGESRLDALADALLVAGGARFPAHRLVLAAASRTFRDIFQSTERGRDTVVVVLHNMSAECVRALLEFMYRGEVRVTEEFLPCLLRAADELHVHGLSSTTASPASPSSTTQEASLSPSMKKRKRQDSASSNENNSKHIQHPAPSPAPAPQQAPAPLQAPALAHPPNYNHLSDIIPKLEPIDSPVLVMSNEHACAGALECERESGETTKAQGVARVTREEEKDIQKEIEEVLQSGTVVETFAVEQHDNSEGVGSANERSGAEGACSYASPSFPCPFCPRVYNSWGYRRRHVKSRHLTDRLSCKWCVRVLRSSGAWYGHATRAHGVPHEEARNCLVVMVEAHAVLTLHQPSPDHLLHQVDITSQV